MKRINVVPLKSVNGIKFGESRANVRREFGRYTEKAKGTIPNSKQAEGGIDDFGYCEAYYNAGGKLAGVIINPKECRVVVGSTSVDTSSPVACKRSMGMSSNVDYKRSICINESGNNVSCITFAESQFFGNDPNPSDKKDDDKDDKKDAKKDPDKKEDPVKKESTGDAVSDLSQFYDNLKSQLDGPANPPATVMRVGGGMMSDSEHPGALLFRRKATDACNELKDKCCKHILLDIYCKVLPLDADYIDGHRGQTCSDVDSMLTSKDMTPTQYLTSCSNATKAPLLEFVMRSINNIGKDFMEKADEALKDAQENDIKVSPPEAPEIEDDNDVSSQLVDVTKDTEYEDFIDKLKEKTINRIVKDVSKIISDKKEEKDMTFDPQPGATIADQEAATESTVSVGINYLQKKVYTENVSLTPDMQDQIIGMAIREATLNEIDACFNQPGTDYKSFADRIRKGRGVIINESAATYILEHVASV